MTCFARRVKAAALDNAAPDTRVTGDTIEGPVMHDILIPRSLLSAPDSFGGRREGECQRGALVIREGRAVGLRASDEPTSTPCILLPRLTDPHCHLDKCHTIARMGPVAGDLATAIAAQKADKSHWTERDILTRATRGLGEARAAGTGALRSHVDWGDDAAPPLAWHVLRALVEDTPDITVQLAPLTGIDRMADAGFAKAVAREAAQVGGALGALVLGHAQVYDGLHHMMAAAADAGVPLDFHVDESLGSYNGLEAIADAALAARFEGPILCGHAVSLMDRDPDAIARIADKLVRANVAICALPTTNLYLQDRQSGTPDRRGLTRLRELRRAGVTVLIGSDNVGDAFCPMGQFDPMAALHLAALAAHLDPPMGQWLPMITTDARRAMGLATGTVDGARVEDLLCSGSCDLTTLVAGHAALTPAPVPGPDSP